MLTRPGSLGSRLERGAPLNPARRRVSAFSRCLALTGAIVGLLVAPSIAFAVDGWSAPTQLTGSSSNGIAALSCASPTLCVAADTHDLAKLGSSGEAYTYNGSAWSGASSPDLDWVSCPPGSSSCVALGYISSEWNEFTYSAGTWTSPLAPVATFSSYPDWLSCASSTFCVLTDSLGDAYVDNNGTWTEDAKFATTDDHLVQVSCASSSLCVAVAIAPSGTDGIAYTYSGTGWSGPAEFDTVGQITSVSCAAGTSFCAAVDLGGNAFIYNGGSWSAAASLEPAPTSHKGHDGLSSVSCASSSFCVAVDGLGNAFTYNGSTWSAAVKIDSSTQTTAVCSSGDQFCYGLASVSCASAAFCVALDNNGDVLTLGGPSGSSAPTATGSHLSATAGTAVSVVGVDSSAKPGTKVTAKLSGTESKHATLKVSASHSFQWGLGKLKAGSYKATFTIDDKTIKTTTIVVKGKTKKKK